MIETIKKKRKQIGMSQAILAEKCGIPQSTIGRIEAKTTIPKLDTLEKIMKILDLEIILQNKDNRPPHIKKWDALEFTCYWKDEPVSQVLVKGTRAYIKRFVKNHPVKQIFFADEMDIFKLSEILKTRCWEENRADVGLHLKKLGLAFYDPLEIVKKTHGVSYNDFLWIQFSGEHLTWKDVAPRSFKYVENSL